MVQQSSSKLQITIKNKNMMKSPEEWPEPVIRVQSLSDSGLSSIPDRYIKPKSQRPNINLDSEVNIPIVDLTGLFGPTGELDLTRPEAEEVLTRVGDACRDWGFFQIVNHGLSPGLMERVSMTWREFFHLPVGEKVVYANSPKTYEGYGSRLGVQKGAVLDWSDYYFLHHLPLCLMDPNKWPHYPLGCREVIEEYGKEVMKLCERLLRVLSVNLGLKEEFLQSKFGGEDIGACLRVNYYPKCPQPELALGLSSHSDPGGMTVLLPDDQVTGLQVRKGDSWITVKPVPHAFIVNIGDQIQVLSNAIYKSVEHRVVVNSGRERLSLAFFYNPKSDIPIEPAKELVTSESPALYNPMTFDKYRLFIRMRGPQGKSQVESLKSPR